MDNDQLFEEPTETVIDPATDFLAELVGEGKKFKDTNELARGKAEADRHIANMVKDMDGLRQELNSRLTMEQLVDKLNEKSKVNTQPYKAEENNEQVQPPQNINTFSREDVERLIEERENKQKQEQNRAMVEQKLKEAFGDNYATTVNEKVKELGVNKDFLQDMISRQPQAFLKLVEADKPKEQPDLFPTPNSSVNTTSFSNPPRNPSGAKNFKQWEEWRKQNPSEYWKGNIQSKMHKDAELLGEKFYP